MKTAEEWYNGLHVRLRDFADPCDLQALFRVIQADALRHAAELCKSMGDIHSNPSLADCHYHNAERLKAEADKLLTTHARP